MNILVVDEKQREAEQTAELFSRTLQKDGCQDNICIDISDSSPKALRLMDEKKYDLICSEIELKEESGITFAKKVEEKEPQSNFIFIARNSAQNLEAWNTCACAFILKPVDESKIHMALERLRYPVIQKQERVIIQCFGAFSVHYQGERITFKRKKSLEMLAVLVDRGGKITKKEYIRSCLWDEAENTEKKNGYIRQLASDIVKTFHEVGVENILYNTAQGYGLNTSIIYCDYYDYKKGKITKNHPAYMMQYDWARLN